MPLTKDEKNILKIFAKQYSIDKNEYENIFIRASLGLDKLALNEQKIKASKEVFFLILKNMNELNISLKTKGEAFKNLANSHRYDLLEEVLEYNEYISEIPLQDRIYILKSLTSSSNNIIRKIIANSSYMKDIPKEVLEEAQEKLALIDVINKAPSSQTAHSSSAGTKIFTGISIVFIACGLVVLIMGMAWLSTPLAFPLLLSGGLSCILGVMGLFLFAGRMDEIIQENAVSNLSELGHLKHELEHQLEQNPSRDK